MALPSSGPLTFADIQTEFGGTNPIGLNEYYAGGAVVGEGTSGTYGAVPSSGTISVQNFYGTTASIPRGFVAGGRATNFLNVYTCAISYWAFASTGNSSSFGNLSYGRSELGACGAVSRIVFCGGLTTGSGDSDVNTMDYINPMTTGTATTFGEMFNNIGGGSAGGGNTTRGIWFGGEQAGGGAAVTTIAFITYATTGNGSSFGSSGAAVYYNACFSSPTRTIGGPGYYAGNPGNVIQYVTTATTGNALSFGSNSFLSAEPKGASSSTRGILGSGYNSTAGGNTSILNYITIATTGNTASFGFLPAVTRATNSCSSNTYAVWASGSINNVDAPTTNMQYVTIATLSNSSTWGTLTTPVYSGTGASNCSGAVQ